MNKQQTAAVNAIRMLSIEGVQAANSGHPGMPLGAAPIGFSLFANHFRHVPTNPNFYDRDRFVLSAGHGSMLLYSLLHLFGYNITKEDLKNFRQFDSITTGHPETGITPGVDVSTGPLGQGIANAVGFAIAERIMAERFNKDELKLTDHYTYALCGDGCLQEGIAYEAASLAGTLGLGKLIVLYDCNKITIEGSIDLAFTEDVAKRHEAQGWQVLRVQDGENVDQIDSAIKDAKSELNKPSLIIINTTIGHGSPRAGLSSSHGAPLGLDGVKATREFFGWSEAAFEIPNELKLYLESIASRVSSIENEWNNTLQQYKQKFPQDYAEFVKWTSEFKLSDADKKMLFECGSAAQATRKSSHILLNKLSDIMPNLYGGSADLGPSNLTILDGKGSLKASSFAGRNIHFGIREHAMAAICNGMKLHGGIQPYCATFFAFSDYMKNAIRMSALMDLNVWYVFTHDSIGVGEDGPTHQPIEHLAGLRAMPNLNVFRPADYRETAAAYISAIEQKCPTAIIASRQDLPQLDGTGEKALRGAYIISDSKKSTPDVIIIATGSEVSLSLSAKDLLTREGIDARVVSMPCMELFEMQDEQYIESVLPLCVRARVAVEAASSKSFGKYVGLDGEYVCIDGFGRCGKPETLWKYFGFTAENIAAKAKQAYQKNAK